MRVRVGDVIEPAALRRNVRYKLSRGSGTSDMQGLVWGEPELPEDVFSFC